MSSEYKMIFEKALEDIKSVNYNKKITNKLKDEYRYNLYDLRWEENTDVDYLVIEYIKKKRYGMLNVEMDWLRCVPKKCGIEILGMNE